MYGSVGTVKQHGLALEFVPDVMKSPELCLAAFETSKYAMQYIPENTVIYTTEESALAAVNRDGIILKHVSGQCRTKEVCLAAINNNIAAMRYI